MFDFILVPLKWVIDQFYFMTGSYALAIVLFTVAIKMLFLPLEIKQRKNTRKMAALQPKIDKINERYKNDPEKRSQKTMALYKEEKASPFSSCLPMLIQFPILIAMVTVMNMAANDGIMQMFLDVYHGVTSAPVLEKFLWVNNIFQPDNITAAVLPNAETVLAQLSRARTSAVITPENLALLESSYDAVITPFMDQFSSYANGWGILPVLSGALQFLQTKLTPQPVADSSQNKNQKMMQYMMPVISIMFCWNFNAAFALYWVMSSLVSIAQNLVITFYYKRKDARESEGVLIS
ncbi:MAG: YidC/Oxa1 family membrane protein insertase [Christensenellales bacterium]|jgi:YidC/Oxa1 family membrane protein insertase